jgi:hypothetical protein
VPGFLSSRQNWLPPAPHPLASVAPLWFQGGHTRLRERGCGEPIRTKGRTIWYSSYSITSGFWPRVRAHALRAPVFLGSVTCQTGRCTPPAHRRFAAPPKMKNKLQYFQIQNAFLQARTRDASGVYFSTGLSCTLLSYIAPY